MANRQRSDKGEHHAMTAAGREACALAATRHGVYGMLEGGGLPRCSTCPEELRVLCRQVDDAAPHCPIIGRLRAELLDSLQDQLEECGGHIKAHEWPLVVEYVKTYCTVMRIDQVIQAVGTERSVVESVARKPAKQGESYEVKIVGVSLHPLSTLRNTLSGQLLRQAEQLGLSPMGRKKLEIKGDSRPSAPRLDELGSQE